MFTEDRISIVLLMFIEDCKQKTKGYLIRGRLIANNY